MLSTVVSQVKHLIQEHTLILKSAQILPSFIVLRPLERYTLWLDRISSYTDIVQLLLRLEKYPHRMNFHRGILELRKQHYKHLNRLLVKYHTVVDYLKILTCAPRRQ